MARKEILKVVCDRCGKEIDENPLELADWIKPCFVYMKPKLMIHGTNKTYERTKNPYDICPECAKSFEKWFESAENEHA